MCRCGSVKACSAQVLGWSLKWSFWPHWLTLLSFVLLSHANKSIIFYFHIPLSKGPLFSYSTFKGTFIFIFHTSFILIYCHQNNIVLWWPWFCASSKFIFEFEALQYQVCEWDIWILHASHPMPGVVCCAHLLHAQRVKCLSIILHHWPKITRFQDQGIWATPKHNESVKISQIRLQYA